MFAGKSGTKCRSLVIRLMLVTHRGQTPLPEYLDFVRQCARSGLTCVQLREKNSDPAFTLEFAQRLKELLTPLHIPLLINDDVNLALQVEADGVHLGQTDTDVSLARTMLGQSKCIGLSIEALPELEKSSQQAVQYVAASAIFPSQNKHNVKTVWGLAGLKQLAELTTHPLIAIGGINEYNAAQVMDAGAQGIAVIGALHHASDPAKATMALRKIIDRKR